MLHQIKKTVFRLFGSKPNAEVTRRTSLVTLNPKGKPCGRVLLSYVLDPFLGPPEEISNDHTHFWESYCMAHCFLDRDFIVDVIHYENYGFRPNRAYDVFIGARTNFERIAHKLAPGCLKIVHLDTAHWLYNNTAADKRSLDLLERRGVALPNAKRVAPNWALEVADMGTVLGNAFTIQTYEYAAKPLFRIPISVPHQYKWLQQKKLSSARRNFMWFGSAGFVHKGLDLVLEAFRTMPECNLYVCGPLHEERRFCEAFEKELRYTDNIHAVGWVDVTGERFLELAQTCAALIYPSCSEGGGGSVLTCMHAGLIPIVTPQSSVDVGGFGLLIEQASIDEVKKQVGIVANMSLEELEQRCYQTWEYARTHHTRALFEEHFGKFVDQHVLSQRQAKVG